MTAAATTACGSPAPAPSRPPPTRQPATRQPASGPPAAVDRLTLAQQVGQTVILSFAGRDEPAYVARILRARRAAGVILTPENIASGAQVRALTRSLERSAGGRALVGADQEGGATRALGFAAASAAQPEQAGPAAAGAAARAGGRDLRRYGLNLDFAPVADVAAGAGSIMRGRAYPGGPPEVAASVAAAVAGYTAAGVAATAKHFPGLGAAGANTDSSPVTVPTSVAGLRHGDLEPFRAAISAGVPLIMTSHAVYPAVDPGRIASQSPRVIGGLLRGGLGFRGVVITDSIEAAAVRRRSSVAVAAVRSIAAGADIVLMTGPGSYHLIYPRLLARARRSPGFRRRVREAAARVLALERRLGLPA
ncbi:MAG: beta-N-acetylhexosaminidase [Solirubrobacteraceae bacterium]|jgi:beta-N-acetylhexosaminidase|nr:beta-N-acetylhexosaminidase [Solirubrobacteraceae bacterium]